MLDQDRPPIQVPSSAHRRLPGIGISVHNPPIMHEWYYVKNGEQQGPVNLEQLRQLAAGGQLEPQDLVWNASMKDWTAANQVDGIFSPTANATPAPTDEPATIPAEPLEPIQPGSEPLDIGAVINHTIELTKRNIGPLIILGLVYFAISMALSLIVTLIQGAGGVAADNLSSRQGEASAAVIATALVGQVVTNIVSLYLSLGMTRACLDLTTGQRAINVQILFSQADKLLRAFGASILCAFIVVVGLICLILPGIYLALRLSATLPAIVDRDMRVMEALSYSMHLTKGNLWQLLGLWFVGVIAALVVILLTCGVGAIIATPVLTLGLVVSYQWLQYGRRSLSAAGF